jgi:predicted urease superfamily metal-dependent hydrolase
VYILKSVPLNVSQEEEDLIFRSLINLTNRISKSNHTSIQVFYLASDYLQQRRKQNSPLPHDLLIRLIRILFNYSDGTSTTHHDVVSRMYATQIQGNVQYRSEKQFKSSYQFHFLFTSLNQQYDSINEVETAFFL